MFPNHSDNIYQCILDNSQFSSVIVIRPNVFVLLHVTTISIQLCVSLMSVFSILIAFSMHIECVFYFDIWIYICFIFHVASYPSTGRCYWWKRCSRWRRCGYGKYCDYRYGKTGVCCSRCTYLLSIYYSLSQFL